MKKLMIMLAAVALAVCSQAAVVKWGTTSAAKLDGVTQKGATCQLYLVGLNGAEDVLIDTRTTGASGLTLGKLSSNFGESQSVAFGDSLAGGVVDASRSVYMIITSLDGSMQQITASTTIDGLTSTQMGTVSFTINDTKSEVAGTVGTWTAAVPEPTSGLLMLVGLGALALRRRA